MTVRELIKELEGVVNQDAQVTVECEHQGDGVFNHAVHADEQVVGSWDVDDNE